MGKRSDHGAAAGRTSSCLSSKSGGGGGGSGGGGGGGGGAKCHREGKITRNPFLNFLRTFRKEHCGLDIIQIAIQGGKAWQSMGCEQRRPFIDSAQKAPKMKRHPKRGGLKRRRIRLCS